MKKYLMTGIAALAMCAGFTSCSHDVEPISQDDLNKLEAQKIVEKYNQAFLKYVGGNIAADQTWGFGGYTATRAANTNGNIWYKDWERPYNVNLSSEEIAELKGLLTKTPNTVNTYIFPYENYYVEQIYKGVSSDVAYDNNGRATNTSVTGSNQMDHLQARDGNHYTHINNFNYGNNTTQMVDEGNGTRYIGITLMENMSLNGITATNQFGYSESWGTENGKFYNNYYIVEYKGEWYVGFDFEGHKSTDTHNNGEAMQVYRDWAFTDWIVRISPAVAKDVDPDPDNVCIIAEDLSAEGDTDFDFNDVVFTVTYTSASTATVTLYAAGGTLPLTVAGQEVHAKFGYAEPNENGLYKMINTGAKADVNGVAPVSFDVISQKSTRGNDIEILVDKGTKNEQGVHVPNWIALTAAGGVPAAKLCVGTDYATSKKWCDERESIKTKYPAFSEWVANSPTLIWWK